MALAISNCTAMIEQDKQWWKARRAVECYWAEGLSKAYISGKYWTGKEGERIAINNVPLRVICGRYNERFDVTELTVELVYDDEWS